MRYTLAVIALVASAGAHAQYPSKAIRFVVPFPPGGPLDIVARSIGQDVSKAWAQPVLVDNRPGAGGHWRRTSSPKAPPDGRTILMGAVSTRDMDVWLYSTSR